MEGTQVVKNRSNCCEMVCPSAEELSVITNSICCEQCGLLFQNEPRYRLHNLKVHQRKKLGKITKENVRYHCPVETCVYALESERFFTTMKYLKQHYLKVHAEKTFACTRCAKSFSTEAAKEGHMRVCGIEFTCYCSKTYSTYEALLTHAKRSLHAIDDKYKSSLRRANSKTTRTVYSSTAITSMVNKPVNILPSQNNKEGNNPRVSAIEKVTISIGIQTEECKRYKRASSPLKQIANNNGTGGKRRVSKQTQTVLLQGEKHDGKSTETQTQDTEFIRKEAFKIGKRRKSNSVLKTAESSLLKEDINIEDNFTSSNLFPASPLPLRYDVGLQDFWEEKNNSGTQTIPEKDLFEALHDNVSQTDLETFYNHSTSSLIQCLPKSTIGLMTLPYAEDSTVAQEYSFSSTNNISRSDPMLTEKTFHDKFSSIETQTELGHPPSSSSFLDSDALSRTFALSSTIETQTTDDFDNMEQLFYNNTYTQTSDEMIPSDLVLTNIQTQTTWTQLDDTTVSAETQTKSLICETGCNISMGACRSCLSAQTSHTETQTDLLSIFEGLQ